MVLLETIDFTPKILEVLLGIILLFTSGAYSFLWYKIRRIEENQKDNEDMMKKMYKRFFGLEEDQTDLGYLVETENEFEKIDKRFDCLEDKIDIIESNNRQSHEEVQAMMQQIIAILDEQENIDIKAEDMEEFKKR